MNIVSLFKAALAAALVALWLSGCASQVHSPYAPGLEMPRLVPAALTTGRFDYTRSGTPPIVQDQGESGGYLIKSLTFRSVGENGQKNNLVTARYYQSKSAGDKPLIIILPIWGKYTYPPNTMAEHVLDRSDGSIDVLQMLGDDYLFDWEGTAASATEAEFLAHVKGMTRRLTNAVIDVRRLVDWARRQPGVDRDRVALVGFSISAIVASLTLAHEPRLSGGVLIMGGADLHEAMASCDSLAGSLRDVITGRFGWSAAEYADKIEGPMAPINPARYATRVDPRRILIVESAYDTCLPAEGRERLWVAMGRPERISYLYDHKMAFMSMTFLGGNDLQKQVYRFLKRALDLETPKLRLEAEHAKANLAGRN